MYAVTACHLPVPPSLEVPAGQQILPTTTHCMQCCSATVSQWTAWSRRMLPCERALSVHMTLLPANPASAFWEMPNVWALHLQRSKSRTVSGPSLLKQVPNTEDTALLQVAHESCVCCACMSLAHHRPPMKVRPRQILPIQHPAKEHLNNYVRLSTDNHRRC